MKKTALTLALFLSVSSYSFGAHLSPEEALMRYRSDSSRQSARAPGSEKISLISTEGGVYVFGNSRSFVLLPDDDRLPAVLGYSDTDSFSIDGNPALRDWLGYYNEQIEALNGKEGIPTFKIPLRDRAEISPLLSTEWNQESPYNELCPKVDGHETVTGCVATAMAQAMKFYNYPPKGKGTHSYYWDPGKEELSFDYDNTPFDWNNMTDRYDRESSEESKKAVAELMLACGISVDMHYEPGGSGAATTQMGMSLIDIFGYSASLWMPNRVFYGYYEWEDMIYGELSEGRPVLYSGAGTAGGHQFICDGFREGYFHFNWGWGGLSNGYFLLTALNPDDLGVGGGAGGFNSSQVATLGFQPGTGNEEPVYIMYNVTDFLPDVEKVKADEDFRCTGEYFNYSLATLPANSRLGMKFRNTATGEVVFAEGPGVDGYRNGDGRYDLQVKFPSLADGDYVITPALKVEGKWSAVRMPVGYPAEVYAAVKNGEATLTGATDATVTVTDIGIPATIYKDLDFPMTFTVENSGTAEYYNRITPYLIDSEGTAVAVSVFRPIDIMPDEREHITDYIGKFSAEKDQDFAAGKYELVWRDDANHTVSTPVEVNVLEETEATEVTITDFHLDQTNPVKDPEAVKFGFTIRCEKGYFFNAPHLAIFHGDGGYELYGITGERYYILAGEEKNGEVTADLSRMADGEYMGVLYYEGHQVDKEVFFRIERDTSGATVITTDPSGNGNGAYFDLNGVSYPYPAHPGIYIHNGKKEYVQ